MIVNVAISISHYLDANQYHLLFDDNVESRLVEEREGASFDEDSPIKDTKGNHEEMIPAHESINIDELTNVRATICAPCRLE